MTTDAPAQVGHVSWSQLSSWLKCGKQYELERIIKAPQTPGVWLAGGSAVHEWTEIYDTVGLEEAAFAGTWTEVWNKHFTKQASETDVPPTEWRAAGRTTKDKPNGEDLAWWKVAGLQMCREYHAWRTGPAAGWTLYDPGVEVDVSALFAGGVLAKIYLDRLFVMPTGQLVVVDIKTGTKVPDPQQLGWYAAAVERTLGVRPSLGTYYMARKGTIEVPFDLDNFTGKYWDHIMGKFVVAKEHEIFLPNPSPLCRSCSVNTSCYYYSGALAAGVDPLATK